MKWWDASRMSMLAVQQQLSLHLKYVYVGNVKKNIQNCNKATMVLHVRKKEGYIKPLGNKKS